MKKINKYLNFPCIILVFTASLCYGLPSSLCKTENKTELTDTAIQYFANTTINSLFTFNFINYKNLSNQSHLLSEQAWDEYNDYLNKLGLLKATSGQQLTVGSYFISSSEISSKKDGVWQVNVPFIFVYKSANESNFKPLIATMTVLFNDKQPYDCGLKVTDLEFNPDISLSLFDKMKNKWDAIQLRYQPTDTLIQKPEEDKDLKQAGSISDIDVITAVNTWIIKQPNFNASMLDSPLVVIQKGGLQGTFAWRIQVNKDKTVLVTRDNNSLYGLNFQ